MSAAPTRDLPRALEHRRRALGLIGVHVHLQRARVAHDEHRVAQPLERSDEARRAQSLARHGEVGAEAICARAVLGMTDPCRRVVVELRRLVAAKRGHEAGEHDRQAVAAGVDDARLAQHFQQVGAAFDRLLAGVHRSLQCLRDRRVLRARARVRGDARVAHGVRDVGHDLVRHLARDGQDRALGRLAHRRVGAVGGFGQSGADQGRVHQLARPRNELLGRPADQLGEDHAGVAARAEQRGACHRLHDLIAADLIDRARPRGGLQPVELIEHGAQRERHVVSRVPVGDGEDIEVVDLLPARFQVRQRPRDRGAEAGQVGICHSDTSITQAGQRAAAHSRGLGDLAGFQAARAHVHAPRGTAHEDPDLLQVGVKAPLRRDHRVAAAVTERGALAAAVTDLCHRAGQSSWRATRPADRDRRSARAARARRAARRARSGRSARRARPRARVSATRAPGAARHPR